MREFVVTRGLVGSQPPIVLAESWARDSFENVFFSMLCFRHEVGDWPSRVGVVSWKFKAVRFYLIACGLKLGDGGFVFHGSGDPTLESTIRTVAAANAKYDAAIVRVGMQPPDIVDPLYRDAVEFGRKRTNRTSPAIHSNDAYLAEVKAAYDTGFRATRKQGDVGDAIDAVERAGVGVDWETATWPWR